MQKSRIEQGSHSYLLGTWKHGGWWYYYLAALAVKIPLGVWILFGLACRARLIRLRQSPFCRDDLLLRLPPLALLFLVSSQTGSTTICVTSSRSFPSGSSGRARRRHS